MVMHKLASTLSAHTTRYSVAVFTRPNQPLSSTHPSTRIPPTMAKRIEIPRDHVHTILKTPAALPAIGHGCAGGVQNQRPRQKGRRQVHILHPQVARNQCLGRFPSFAAYADAHHPGYDCKIKLVEGKTPAFLPIYSLTEAESVELRRTLDDLLSRGHIRASKSPCGHGLSPMREEDDNSNLFYEIGSVPNLLASPRSLAEFMD
ncbi:hypothetical protein BCR44DRAFT_325280 [Catenaria anguillulae PL171]|uniref:Uncharacterized protein n=1 Tax=Catenaria anguillulae PL171 TaxID=765915 RepID=A0A1Y2H4G7_9FUNG|nr:hypothetical protein BCR44DRAFT_325280 [Catenaria anguillulae PL171]